MSSDFFFHNWIDEVSMETLWSTDVVPSATTLAEARRVILQRPQRLLSFRFDSDDLEKSTRMLFSLARLARQDFFFPIVQDVSVVTADSSGTTLNCDPNYRRFNVNFDLVVLPWNEGVYGEAVQKTISAINPSDIEVTSAFASTIPKGSLVFPVITAYQGLGDGISFTTDDKGTWNSNVLEVVDSNKTLPGIQDPLVLPPAFPTFSSAPVLDLGVNWAEDVDITHTRSGQIIELGRAQIANPVPVKGTWVMEASFLFSSRSEFWDFLQLWDWAQGRHQIFFALLPVPFFTLVATATTHIDVDDSFDLTDWINAENPNPDVAVVLKDGTFHIRQVQTVISTAGVYRINFFNPIPVLSVDDVERVTLAITCRFTEDSLTERWVSNEVCRVRISLVEILAEQDHDIANVRYVPGIEPIICP